MRVECVWVVLYNCKRKLRTTDIHLELEAEIDDEGVGHGLDLDPVAVVENLKAMHGARVEEGDEVPVAVGRKTQGGARVRARRIAVDAEDHVAAAEVAVEVVRPEPHGFAQQPQQLHPHSSCQHGELLENLPVALLKLLIRLKILLVLISFALLILNFICNLYHDKLTRPVPKGVQPVHLHRAPKNVGPPN